MPKAASAKKTKIQIVKEILESGILKASDIVAAAKGQGVELSEATAANYKHQLGYSKARKGRKSAAPKTVKAPVVRSTEGVVTSDMALENLALRLIIKAGSVDKARSLIDRLA